VGYLHDPNENPRGSEWELEQEYSCSYIVQKTHTFQKRRSITDRTKLGSLTFCRGVIEREDDSNGVAWIAPNSCA
jgi:hypothetical protein